VLFKPLGLVWSQHPGFCADNTVLVDSSLYSLLSIPRRSALLWTETQPPQAVLSLSGRLSQCLLRPAQDDPVRCATDALCEQFSSQQSALASILEPMFALSSRSDFANNSNIQSEALGPLYERLACWLQAYSASALPFAAIAALVVERGVLGCSDTLRLYNLLCRMVKSSSEWPQSRDVK
jgi:hypothetical protein